MYTMSFCLPCGQCSCLPLAEAPADYLSTRTPTDFSEPLQSRDRLCWRYRNVWQVAARIGRHRDHVFRSQDKVYRTRNIRISAILFKLHHATNGQVTTLYIPNNWLDLYFHRAEIQVICYICLREMTMK
jgi:hypothetical protein